MCICGQAKKMGTTNTTTPNNLNAEKLLAIKRLNLSMSMEKCP
jgi:hypothetical protein